MKHFLEDAYEAIFPRSSKLRVHLLTCDECRLTEAVTRRCSVKKVFLKISQNSQENTCARVSFLMKLQAQTCNFTKKEALIQIFSCEFCEFFKNNFFIEHLQWLLLEWMNFRYTTKYLKFNVLFKLFDKAWLFRKQWYI